MATFIAIPAKTQSKTAMKKVLDYVMQSKKTAYVSPDTSGKYKLISGQNCMPETAYKEFMNTKEQYRKANGVFYKHYVQSFKPDCGATPELIHQIGVELAEKFEGYEVIIATHIDADHWHNHFIVNSVSCETGLKIQINEKGLERLREASDEICKRFGLEVLPPYQKPKQRAMNQREYRAALRGESWKMKLLSAIKKAMQESGSKAQFIHNMNGIGYGVKWVENHKYITYTTPQGQKCRDNKLFTEKYLKSNMEEYFDGLEQTDGNKRRNQRNTDRAVSANPDWSQTRAMERADTAHGDGWDSDHREYGAHSEAADAGRFRQFGEAGNPAIQHRDDKGYKLPDKESGGNNHIRTDGEREIHSKDSIRAKLKNAGKTANAGFITDKVKSQVGGDWGDIAGDALALAASIESMVESSKQKKKKGVAEQKRKRQKKTQEREWSMER